MRPLQGVQVVGHALPEAGVGHVQSSTHDPQHGVRALRLQTQPHSEEENPVLLYLHPPLSAGPKAPTGRTVLQNLLDLNPLCYQLGGKVLVQ